MDEKMLLISSPLPHVAMIKLNRPDKRNALNGELIATLISSLHQLEKDPQIRIVIFSGEGTHFCAGADIAWMQTIAKASHDENVKDAIQLATLMKKIYTFSKPTMILAHGSTLGGGLGMIACCDIAIATEDAMFCFSETKIGLTPSVISPYVISAIGERAARYYFLTAERFDARRAREIGLIHQVTPQNQLHELGINLSQTLLLNSPYALQEAKKLISHVANEKLSDDISAWTAAHLSAMRSHADAKEGLKAFLEKRAAHWE